MKFKEIQRQLDRFGDAVATGQDGNIVFLMETSFRGAQTVEKLATTVDNTPKAELVVTGNRSSDALILIEIPYEAFETVPPYIEDEL